MTSTVYFGSPRQARLEAKETLPAKLDLILEQLHLRDRVKGETVALKMHLGNNLSYSTIHPVFVARWCRRSRMAAASPLSPMWIGMWRMPSGAATPANAGLPHLPSRRGERKVLLLHHHPFKNIQEWKVAGMIQDATFLVNFAHVKGHPSCGFGGAFKNLALGCMVGETRSAMHDTMHFDRYWFPEKCPDAETRQQIMDVLPASRPWWRTRTIPASCTCTSSSATSAGAACRWRLPAA